MLTLPVFSFPWRTLPCPFLPPSASGRVQAHSGLQRAPQTQNLPEHLLASAVGCEQGLDVCSLSENHINAGHFLQEPRADLQKPGCGRPVHQVASRPSNGGVRWEFQFPHSGLRPASATAHANTPAVLNTAC